MSERPRYLVGDDPKNYGTGTILAVAIGAAALGIGALWFVLSPRTSQASLETVESVGIAESVTQTTVTTRSSTNVVVEAKLKNGREVRFSSPKGYLSAVTSALTSERPVRMLLSSSRHIWQIEQQDANGKWAMVMPFKAAAEEESGQVLPASLLALFFVPASIWAFAAWRRRLAVDAWDRANPNAAADDEPEPGPRRTRRRRAR